MLACLLCINASGGEKRRKTDVLDRFDIFSLKTFLTLGHDKANLLAFSQGTEAVALDLTEMGKHIRTVVLSDEAKTFLVVEPLHSTSSSSHILILYIKIMAAYNKPVEQKEALLFMKNGQKDYV